MLQSVNVRFPSPPPPPPEQPGYEALLTCMSVPVSVDEHCVVYCKCFSNTAGIVIWMWWGIWWLKLTVILMSGTMMERLLSIGPAGEYISISTRKYCVGRGRRAWEWDYYVCNACVKFNVGYGAWFAYLSFCLSICIQICNLTQLLRKQFESCNMSQFTKWRYPFL